jgi:aminoglycoside phosphotransferase family enzyme/predicted kinase
MSEPTLIAALRRPDAYPHAVGPVRVAETHISWVLLTGDFAYKIKKPVDFGFLDFSTLAQRRFCCGEELRLNRRLAPDLYLEVVPITGEPARPRIGGAGAAFEYAVKMRQFDGDSLFDRLAREGRLLPEHLERLAETVAAFHQAAGRATATDDHGRPEQCQEDARQNFAEIRPLLEDDDDLAGLDRLRAWTEREYRRLQPVMLERKRHGWVRECHGDLHLGNIVLLEGCPTPFDGIEFSEGLRWIDTVNEIAFLVMDLEVRGERELGFRFLNRYLEATGDYRGLALFGYYRLYRAMVRAKIAQLTLAQEPDPRSRQELLARYRSYIDYGLAAIRPGKPLLLITHGFSGSGKSYLAGLLAPRLAAIRLRSDLERKRLAGLAAEARTGSLVGAGLYAAEATRRTYGHLLELAEALLNAGLSVIVDATFLKREQREEQRRLAERLGAAFAILDCRAPVETLRKRIEARARAGADPSEADPAVLESQIAGQEPLTEDERGFVSTVDTGEASAADRLVEHFLMRVKGAAA